MTPAVLQKTKEYINYRDSSILVDDPSLDVAIGFESETISESCFSDVYYKAVGLMVLHVRELNKINTENGSSMAGVLKSEKEDKLSVTIDTSASNMAGIDLSRTGYGQEFELLSKSYVSGKTFFNSRMSI